MVVDLRTNTELGAYYRGAYDSAHLEIICALLDPDSFFVDVGANVGFYTVAIGNWIRAQGGLGRVIAFEPVEGNYKRLIENVNGNDLEAFCSLHKVALSSESADGLITLREDFLRGSATGNAAVPTNDKFDEGFAQIPIELERLDDIWPELYGMHGRLDVMKIDIEGHEDFCLEGGKQTIGANRPTILMEINPPYYDARGVNPSSKILPLIPESYVIYGQGEKSWERMGLLDERRGIYDVFLIPREKLGRRGYGMFG